MKTVYRPGHAILPMRKNMAFAIGAVAVSLGTRNHGSGRGRSDCPKYLREKLGIEIVSFVEQVEIFCFN